jgi:hypothetical protein
MPVNVGQPNSYNLGRDCTFTIVAPTGILSFPITEGSAKQETKQIQSRPLNGPPIFAEIPDGWSGSFSFDRTGRQLDDLFAQLEASYWNTGALASFSVLQTIENPDGTIAQYQFKALACKFESAGDFKGDGKVEQKVTFRGPRREIVQ